MGSLLAALIFTIGSMFITIVGLFARMHLTDKMIERIVKKNNLIV